MSGYTGPVRRGFAFRDPGQGRLSLKDLPQVKCPECGGSARIELLTVNGEPTGQIFCHTWKPQRKKCLPVGCRPARIQKDELEKIIVTKQTSTNGWNQGHATLAQQQEIRRMLAAANMSQCEFSLACGWRKGKVNGLLACKYILTEQDWATMGSACAQAVKRLEEEAAKESEAVHEAPQGSGLYCSKTEALTVALAELKNTFVEHRNRLADEAAANKSRFDSLELVDGQQWERLNQHEDLISDHNQRRQNTHNSVQDLFVRIVKLEEAEAKRMIDYSRGVGEPLELEYEADQRAQQDPRNPDSARDLLTSFHNFERICRKMRAKCPHLFQAAVRRASEGAF